MPLKSASDVGAIAMPPSPAERLEAYSDEHPREVLLVELTVDGESDRVLIFRGYSSSLVRPTAADPSVPVIPVEAEIDAIARLRAPYQPDDPQYLERDIDWPRFAARLADLGF
ncbi:MAG: hypothetical protein AAFY15_08285 [Cyanobacteria bacterium J06648_11]